MNQAVSASASSSLARYHSAPSSLLASLTDDHGFHLSADASLRTQVLMASLFADDFAPEWQQHQQQQMNGLIPQEASAQMLQPYPGAAADNHFLAQELAAGSVCDISPARDTMNFSPGSSDFGCATGGWSTQPIAAPTSSWLPVTPPKLRLLRHRSSPATLLNHLSGDSSSPATLMNHLSGDCPAGGAENRHKFCHRVASGLARSYDPQEPYLREESSDEMEEDAQFGQIPIARKRCRGKILNQFGSLEVLAAENASIPKQLPGVLLPCNTTPCLARAKRGHATHPRSISERLRRTRISEGIKKLQELVPNIEKQMNTADMLDEAVEYIKCLQRQVEELSKNQVVSSDVKPSLCSSVVSETL